MFLVMIGISSCTDSEFTTVNNQDAKLELRVADPPCYDAPFVPGVINIVSRYLNAQGECCITIQFNPPFVQSAPSTYSICLTNTATGAPLSPPQCFTFSMGSNVSEELCYALTEFPMKITVNNNNKIVTCNSYGKTCD